jgi:hypothetical protein
MIPPIEVLAACKKKIVCRLFQKCSAIMQLQITSSDVIISPKKKAPNRTTVNRGALPIRTNDNELSNAVAAAARLSPRRSTNHPPTSVNMSPPVKNRSWLLPICSVVARKTLLKAGKDTGRMLYTILQMKPQVPTNQSTWSLRKFSDSTRATDMSHTP